MEFIDDEKSASERLKVVAEIKGFRPYEDGLLANILAYEGKIIPKVLPAHDQQEHMKSLGDMIAEVQESTDSRALLVARQTEFSTLQQWCVTIGDVELESKVEEILGADKDIEIFLLTSKGDAYKRSKEGHLDREYEEAFSKASQSAVFVSEELELMKYGFKVGGPRVSLPQVFESYAKALRGSGRTRFIVNGESRKSQASSYTELSKQAKSFEGSGYLLLKKSEEGDVSVSELSDVNQVADKCMLGAIDTNVSDTFWLVNEHSWYEKEPGNIRNDITMDNWDHSSHYQD